MMALYIFPRGYIEIYLISFNLEIKVLSPILQLYANVPFILLPAGSIFMECV